MSLKRKIASLAEAFCERAAAIGSDADATWDDNINIDIRKKDNSGAVRDLSLRLPMPLPPSYRYLIGNYGFPAFDAGPLRLFGNSGPKPESSLADAIFADRHMVPVLLASGMIQFGRPACGSYDPVCFDTTAGKREYPVVRLDHEEILNRGRCSRRTQLYPSFIDYMEEYVAALTPPPSSPSAPTSPSG